MKKLTFVWLLLVTACTIDSSKNTQTADISTGNSILANYQQNRAPLKEKPYLELPLGSIKPKGWVLEQLHRMRDGMTGNLDSIYPSVMGKRNGWLGGDGDGWERGPYWIDGLLPLAYILNDPELKNKVKPWIEWTLNNQREDGYIGPIPFVEQPAYEMGLQRGNRTDWWPKMVMLKILQQYYGATKDERVITTLTKYFKYQLKQLPEKPLDHGSFWANRRGADNLMVVYWLYNITGDDFLLELANIISEQTFPWTTVFSNEENNLSPAATPWHYYAMKRYPFDPDEIKALTVSKIGGMHCVNFAQGLKEPIIKYQQHPNTDYLSAAEKAMRDIQYYHGQPQGMYGGDEPLHGRNPIQGVEFCSIAEMMFSLETMLTITGDMRYADRLEKITYNALPTQASDDYMSRQYFQAANQVQISGEMQGSYQTVDHQGTDFVFGTLTGYPCCTANMHQTWPKYVQNLWYATADKGVAALLYASSEVTMKVGNGADVKITEETGFPFREEVNFSFSLNKTTQFPFHLRVPDWAKNATITVNDQKWETEIVNQTAIIDRKWANGDKVSLNLPMALKASQWYDFAMAIERGPLVYSLKIRGEEKVKDRKDDKYGSFTEVHPLDDWNFALSKWDLEDLENSVKVVENDWDGSYPWNLDNAPIELKMRGVQLPKWKLVNSTPVFPAWWGRRDEKTIELTDITLVPYGCTTLRITEFPVYGLH